MAIIFENIDTGESVAIDRKTEGEHYKAKLSAVMNSSNMSPNADRGQDFGWRLQPEQQALIEMWEQDPEMIDQVARVTRVPEDSLTHADFLTYLLRQQELGRSPEASQQASRHQNQLDYEARVEALKAASRPEVAPKLDVAEVKKGVAKRGNKKRGKETLDDFMSGELTGDASGDKVEDDLSDASADEPVKPADK